MFLGHYALALAAKRAVPRVSLGTLFLATQFLDELWVVPWAYWVDRHRVDASR